LEGILLEIPRAQLNIAGNNTNFTLKLMLMFMLAVRNNKDREIGEDCRSRVQLLREIGQASIEEELSRLTPDQIVKKAKKRREAEVKCAKRWPEKR